MLQFAADPVAEVLLNSSSPDAITSIEKLLSITESKLSLLQVEQVDGQEPTAQIIGYEVGQVAGAEDNPGPNKRLSVFVLDRCNGPPAEKKVLMMLCGTDLVNASASLISRINDCLAATGPDQSGICSPVVRSYCQGRTERVAMNDLPISRSPSSTGQKR